MPSFRGRVAGRGLEIFLVTLPLLSPAVVGFGKVVRFFIERTINKTFVTMQLQLQKDINISLIVVLSLKTLEPLPKTRNLLFLFGEFLVRFF